MRCITSIKGVSDFRFTHWKYLLWCLHSVKRLNHPPPMSTYTEHFFKKGFSRLGAEPALYYCKIMFLVVLSRCIVHRVSVCGDVVGWWVGSGGGWTGGRNGGRAGREGERLEAEAAPGSSSRCCLRPGVGLPSGCWPSPPPPTNPPIHPQALTNTKSSLIIHNHLVTTQC